MSSPYVQRALITMDNGTTEVGLLAVRKEGRILVLLDGRKLYVHPEDIAYVLDWSPTTKLQITRGDADSTFSVNVRNTTNLDEIKARWRW